MPDYHLRSVEKVLELPVTKEAMDVASSLRDQALESPTYNKVENLLIGHMERIAPVRNAILSSAENKIPKEVKTKAKNVVSHLDDLVCGGIERVTTEAPVLAKPSSEIVLIVKKICSTLASYLAGFWVVRAVLRLGDSTLCLVEIMARTVGTPIAEPLGCARRIIHSVLDSAESGVHADDSKAAAEIDDSVIASEHKPTVDEVVMEAKVGANTETFKTKLTNDSTEIKDYEAFAANPNETELVIDEDFTEDFPEEVLRKTSSLAIKEIEPIQLKTYEKRMDVIAEENGFNITSHSIDEDTSTQTEETVEDSIIITEDYTIDLIVSGKESFVEDILSPASPAPPSLGDCVPVLSEETFIAPPAPSSASSPRRYPGYQHLYISQPYQERYDMVEPIENLLDGLIGMVPQLSSSGATSRIAFSAKPQDMPLPLPDDSFDSSF